MKRIQLRKVLLEDVKEARAHGDLSENFEYHAAKKEKKIEMMAVFVICKDD